MKPNNIFQPATIYALLLIIAAGLLTVQAQVSTSRSPVYQPEQRGGKVSWARLQTLGEYWRRHSEKDPLMTDFLRRHTTLDIDRTWQAADVNRLDEMTVYPFLFSEGLHRLINVQQLQNIREYLLRGGFMLVDSCINTTVNPDPDEFFLRQTHMFRSILPGAKVVVIPENHEIYRCYYEMKNGLPHSYMDSIYRPSWAKYGLHAVYHEDRMVAIISLSGLQCGWAQTQTTAGHDLECMKMIVNIYVYAMTH